LTPAEALYFPASQLSHAALTPAEALYFPASQLSHAVLTPAVALYFPASQLVQSAAPANEYVPAPQSVQAAELVCAVKPENLPAPQSVQAVAPEISEYFPAKHQRIISMREA
jgi:hypothetical protein